MMFVGQHHNENEVRANRTIGTGISYTGKKELTFDPARRFGTTSQSVLFGKPLSDCLHGRPVFTLIGLEL